MKRKLLLVAGVVVLLLAAAFLVLTNGLSEAGAIRLGGISLAEVPDGGYTGEYDFKRWTNILTVHVEDHRITSIGIVRDVAAAQITDCADQVFERVIAAQDTLIDTVSGATVTSKAYLASIEDALKD